MHLWMRRLVARGGSLAAVARHGHQGFRFLCGYGWQRGVEISTRVAVLSPRFGLAEGERRPDVSIEVE